MQEGRIRFDLRGIATELKERRLAVPMYQRAYAWSVRAPAEEVAEYWSDLRAAFSESAPEYFLGTIVLEVTTEADVFLIFETLNDCGADLTIADLLKNYLFGHAGSKLDAVRG